jgi:hypothetical protein
MDMDNDKVAEALDEFLEKHGLDGYAGEEEKEAKGEKDAGDEKVGDDEEPPEVEIVLESP